MAKKKVQRWSDWYEENGGSSAESGSSTSSYSAPRTQKKNVESFSTWQEENPNAGAVYRNREQQYSQTNRRYQYNDNRVNDLVNWSRNVRGSDASSIGDLTRQAQDFQNYFRQNAGRYDKKTLNTVSELLRNGQNMLKRNSRQIENAGYAQRANEDYQQAVDQITGGMNGAQRMDYINRLRQQQAKLEPTVNTIRDINEVRSAGDTATARAYDQYNDATQRLEDLRNQNEELRRLKRIRDYSQLTQNEDFAENSGYESTVKRTGPGKLDYSSDDIYEAVNRNYKLLNSSDSAINTQQAAATGGMFDDTQGMHVEYFMNENERSIYNYLYKTQGRKAAYDYLNDLRPDLNKRSAQADSENFKYLADEAPVLSSIITVADKPIVGLRGLATQLGTAAFGGRIDPNDPAYTYNRMNTELRTNVGQNIAEAAGGGAKGEIANLGYQTVMSMLDNLYGVAIGGGFGSSEAENVVLGIMGTDAASSSMIEQLQNGVDQDRAVILGLGAGAAEVLTERIGLDNLFNGQWTGSKEAFKSLARQVFSEGAEEGLSDVMNWAMDDFYDVLASQNESEWHRMIEEYQQQGYSQSEAMGLAIKDRMKELGMDIAGGALSGGLMGAGRGVGSNISYAYENSRIAKNAASDEESLNEIIDSGLQSQEGSDSYKGAVKLQEQMAKGETPSQRQILNQMYRNDMQIAAEEEGLAPAPEQRQQTQTPETIEQIEEEETTSEPYQEAQDEQNQLEIEQTTSSSPKLQNVPTGVSEALLETNKTEEKLDQDWDMVSAIAQNYEKAGLPNISDTFIANFNDNYNVIEYNNAVNKVVTAAIEGATEFPETVLPVNVANEIFETAKEEGRLRYGRRSNLSVSGDAGRILNESQIRQSGSLEEGTGRTDQEIRSAELGGVRESNQPAYSGSNAERAGNQATARSLGLKNGTDDSVVTLKTTNFTPEEQEFIDLHASLGNNVHFYTGDALSFSNNGITSRVRGVIQTGANGTHDIYIRSDDANYSGAQIGYHESYHSDIDAEVSRTGEKRSIVVNRRYNQLENRYGKAIVEEGLLLPYKDLYEDQGMKLWEIKEEMLADLAGNMTELLRFVEYHPVYEAQIRNIYESENQRFKDSFLKNPQTGTKESGQVFESREIKTYPVNDRPSVEQLDHTNSLIEDKNGNPVAEFQEDGSVKFSVSSFENSGRKIYTNYLNKMVKNEELSREEADDMLQEMETIYNICKGFADTGKYAPFTAWSNADVIYDSKGKPVFSAIKKNSEYKMNIDFSTICKKRRTLDAVFREMITRGIMEHLDLNKEESAAMVVNINNLIREHGFEAACALCFVEARRYRQQQTATTFRDMWNGLVESMYPDKNQIAYFNFGKDATVKDVPDGIHTMDNKNLDLKHLKKLANAKNEEGKPLQTAEAKAARLLLKDPSQRKLMRVGDMMASTGFENMQIQNPQLMKIYNAKKGTGGAKSSFGDVQYLNEIIRSKTFNRRNAYSVSGVRIQSFSDYVPRMVFDYVQVIADLAAKKLPAHAYTKEVLFARQFGLTGAKINLSLVPDVVADGVAPGLDANGDYIWNEEGTFPFAEAMELQQAEGYKENCGTIAVGISDEQILKMLADPNIQMVIPYHKSSLNPIVAAMTNVDRFTDYTDFQNTKDADGKTVKKEFDWDNKLFELSHDKNGNMLPKSQWGNVQDLVKEYVDWCDAHNYTAKFSQFLYMEDGSINPGYYKMLEDFALLDSEGNFKPQGDVQMSFPTESDAFGSMASLIEQGLSEDTKLEAKRQAEISGIVDEIQTMIDQGTIAEQNTKMSRELDNVGYHAGDLGKSTADDYAHQGYSRGTGHFGFGTYFVGNEDKINYGDYAKRNHETVDFSKYKLFRPRDFEQGLRLHDALKVIDGFVTQYSEFNQYDSLSDERFENRLNNTTRINRAVENLIDDYEWNDFQWNDESLANKETVDRYIAERLDDDDREDIEYKARKEYNEAQNRSADEETIRSELARNYDVFKDMRDFFGEPFVREGSEEEYIQNRLQDTINRINEEKAIPYDFYYYREAQNVIKRATEDFEWLDRRLGNIVSDLRFALGFKHSEAEIRNALKETERIVNGYGGGYRLNAKPGLDSGSTVFMKQLGYEGVDVRHIDAMDNTEYGSVIYDLKDEDLARKQEIGTARFSKELDAEYMELAKDPKKNEAALQRMVDDAAREAGYRPHHQYHGSLAYGFTVFDKAKAQVGGNSGAGFYFSNSQDDSDAHYADVEGADNFFKASNLADRIIDAGEWNGVEVDDYDEALKIAKDEINKTPGTYDVYLKYSNPYIRDFRNSTNLYDVIMEDFDESAVDRNDYDSDEDYEDDLNYYREEHIADKLYGAIYDAYSDIEDHYEVISGPTVEEVYQYLAMEGVDFQSITWKELIAAIETRDGIELLGEDWDSPANGSAEFARAIVENLGFDAIEDYEVSKKFGQLSREMMDDTVHTIVFSPSQIKSADPVTYDNDGNVIPLSERFNRDNEDIRYSREAGPVKLGKRNEKIRDKVLSGQMLTENEFYNFYSAHQLNFGSKQYANGVEAEISRILENGITHGYMLPTSTWRYTERNGSYMNIIEQQYAPKEGVYTVLIPADYVTKEDVIADRFIPMPQEIIYTERDNQPMYEAYVNGFNSSRFSREIVDVEKLNQAFDELKRDFNALKAENKKNAGRAEYFKGETRLNALSNNPKLDAKRIERTAKGYIRNYGLSMKQEDLTEKLRKYAEDFHFGKKDFNQLADEVLPLANEIVRSAKVLTENPEKEIVEHIRKTKIYISDKIRSDIADYGVWRRQYFGRMDMSTQSGVPVEDFYRELQAAYGTSLFPDSVMNPTDQLMTIANTVEELQPYRLDLMFDSYNMTEATNSVAMELLTDVMDMAPHRTFADRQKEARENLRQKMQEEKTEAVDALRQEKNARIEQLKKDLQQKTKESLKAAREDRDKRIQELKDHYKEIQQNRRQRKQESADRKALLRISQRLERVKTTKANRALIEEMLGTLDTVAVSITNGKVEQLKGWKEWYEQQFKDDKNFLRDTGIEDAISRLEKTQIKDMDIEDVRALTKVMKAFEHKLRTDNKMIRDQDRRDVFLMGQQVIQNVSGSKGNKLGKLDDLFIAGTLTPERAIHRMTDYWDDDPLYLATKRLSDGQREMIDFQMKAGDMFKKWTSDRKYLDRIMGKKAQTIKIRDGVEITPAMLMSLYMHSRNDDNMRHIEVGGVRIPDIKRYRKGDLLEAYAHGTIVQFTRSQIQNMADKYLNAKDKAAVVAMSNYYNRMSQEAINAVSEDLYGYSLAEVEDYFPINADKDYTKGSDDYQDFIADSTIEGMGFLKERIKAKNPIMLRDSFEILTQSINDTSKFVGLAIPVRNFKKIKDVAPMTFEDAVDPLTGRPTRKHTGYEMSLMDVIGQRWGTRGKKYINDMLADLEGNSRKSRSRINATLNKVRSNYAGAVLTLNLSVAMKQAASYPTAAAVLGWSPLIKAFGNTRLSGKMDLELIKKYTPLLWYRMQGYSTQELGDIAQSNNFMNRLINGHKALNWIQAIDIATTKKLWKAAEYYVRDNHKDLEVGTDEYYRQVADIYNQVIEETQPNYTTMQRPDLLRDDNALLASIMMFKTQPFQNFNILYDAIGDYNAKVRHYNAVAGSDDKQAIKTAMAAKKLAGQKLKNGVSALLISTLVFAAMTFAYNMLRRKKDNYEDKEGNASIEGIATGLSKDMASSVAGMIPFGAEAWELIASKLFDEKYYGLNSVTITALSDFVSAGSNIFDLVKDTLKTDDDGNPIEKNGEYWQNAGIKMESNIQDIANAFGIPAANVRKLFNVPLGWGLQSKGEYSGEYEYMKYTKSIQSNHKEVYNLLYGAYKNDREQFLDIYWDLVDNMGFKTTTVKQNIEKKMKEEAGVESVKDLPNRFEDPQK